MSRKIRTRKFLNVFLTLMLLTGLVLLGLWFWIWATQNAKDPQTAEGLSMLRMLSCGCLFGFFSALIALKLSSLNDKDDDDDYDDGPLANI